MLRIEKIFEADGIQEELDVYNPLIPDGSNWKATFMIEYEKVEERKKALAKLIGIEKSIWVKIEDSVRITTTNNDSRSNYKTSFVNNTTESTINGLTVKQRQSLTDALKPKADN